jgi:hypothetical protein
MSSGFLGNLCVILRDDLQYDGGEAHTLAKYSNAKHAALSLSSSPNRLALLDGGALGERSKLCVDDCIRSIAKLEAARIDSRP